MTLLVQPEMYNVAFAIFRTVFGCTPEHLLYEKRKEWVAGEGEKSLTFAMQVGQGGSDYNPKMDNTMIAVVQPSEPQSMSSHVREMLDGHKAAAHWQHIALRTPDLLAFHKHAEDLGVNFITPVLRDESDDVIQVFTGEWFYPGAAASGMFFEFLQRNPSPELLKKLEDRNRESWFNDKTFLGLYGEKETEYQSKKVKPFIDPELFEKIYSLLKNKKVWEISEKNISEVDSMMREHGRKRASAAN
jgi:coenzyme F420-reducing hydrogenase alpha subunit